MKVQRVAVLCMLLATVVVSNVAAQKTRVLMVGNSLTYFNKGLGYVLMQLARSANPPVEVDATLFTLPMFSLGDLWKRSASRQQQILSGKYDLVLLQDYLFVEGVHGEDENHFRENVLQFDRIVRKGGARSVLFMPWGFHETNAMTLEDIVRVHEEVAKDLDVQVAPIGLAWAESEKRNPDLGLYYDSEHPSPYGSYLAGCVLYATLFEKSPNGLTYDGEDLMIGVGATPMKREAIQRLQKVAWEIVKNYPFARRP